MNIDARRENMRALANALGVSEEVAGVKLGFQVTLYYSTTITGSEQFSRAVLDLLSKTIEQVRIEERDIETIAQIHVDSSSQSKLYVDFSNETCIISDREIGNTAGEEAIHPLFLLLCACYTSAAILKAGVPQISYNCILPLKISLSDIIDPSLLDAPIHIGKTYMAGAGAIGNALLWAFRCLDVSGQLHICDDDKVAGGNLNRQLFFDEGDLSEYKACQLAKKAQPYMPELELIPRVSLLQDLEEAGDDFWLGRLISAVDSRRARRTLQGEYPAEVFDASTTDITEVVLHYHKQPTDSSCLACIYHEDRAERSHEENIAEALGVSLDEVREERISLKMAEVIVRNFPDAKIDSAVISGEAYDSLYKALCGQGKLKDSQGEQVLAPFCFVSALAGVMLAIEIVKRLSGKDNSYDYNLWKISAWSPPYSKMKKKLPRRSDCPNCSSEFVRKLLQEKMIA